MTIQFLAGMDVLLAEIGTNEFEFTNNRKSLCYFENDTSNIFFRLMYGVAC